MALFRDRSKILVISHEDYLADSIERTLSQSRFEILYLSFGHSIHTHLFRVQPDLVLIDIHNHFLSETSSAIKQIEHYRESREEFQVPLLAICSASDTQQVWDSYHHLDRAILRTTPIQTIATILKSYC